MRLQTSLAGTVERWFTALPDAPETKLELAKATVRVLGRDRTSVTLQWDPNNGRKIHRVQVKSVPIDRWHDADKADRLHTVRDLTRSTTYVFVLWIQYADGGSEEATCLGTTLDI